jgi:NNP family nitrate/nitrite transporter-like MFS transporter
MRNGSSSSTPVRELTLATLAFFLCFAAWGMLAPIAPKLEDQLGLSNTETAVMIAVPVILGSLLRIPLGRLTDRHGGRLMFTAMLFFAAFPPLLVGTADSYPLLLLAGLLLGVSGASFAIGVPFVASWFATERQGWALGLYGIGTAGTAVSAFAMPALFEGPGRGVAGVIYALVLLGFAFVWMTTARNADVERPEPKPIGEILRLGPVMWQLALFYFVTFGGFVAMSIYLPKLLRDWFDFSLTNAGLRAGGFVIVAALVARPIGGWLADRVGGYRVATIAFFGIGLDAVGLAWQASDPAIVPVTILCLTMAFFLGLGNGAVFKLVPQRFPQATGAVTGIVGAAGGIGGFFPPLVLGVVKDATDTYVMAFVFLVAFAWMCAGLALTAAGLGLEDHQGEDREDQAAGGEVGRPREGVVEERT